MTSTALAIRINECELPIKEINDQRVVTFKDIDQIHGKPEGSARKRFNTNQNHFIENEDYYTMKPEDFRMSAKRTSEKYEKRTLGLAPQDINNRGTIFITETGYLMLVKSFTDKLAWQVQRQLVNNYFRTRQQPGAIPLDEVTRMMSDMESRIMDTVAAAIDGERKHIKQLQTVVHVKEELITDFTKRPVNTKRREVISKVKSMFARELKSLAFINAFSWLQDSSISEIKSTIDRNANNSFYASYTIRTFNRSRESGSNFFNITDVSYETNYSEACARFYLSVAFIYYYYGDFAIKTRGLYRVTGYQRKSGRKPGGVIIDGIWASICHIYENPEIYAYSFDTVRQNYNSAMTIREYLIAHDLCCAVIHSDT